MAKRNKQQHTSISRQIAPHKHLSTQKLAVVSKKPAKHKNGQTSTKAAARAVDKNEQHQFRRWLRSYPAVSACLDKCDLEAMLDANGGFVHISNLLPPFAAEGMLRALQRLPDTAWNPTASVQDYVQNNIAHKFESSKQAPGLQELFRVLSLLAPEALHTFSAARYCRTHHIAPHDDRAYTQVCMDDGRLVTCSRSIAVIYYLTKGWDAACGGALVDLEAPGGPNTYVPQFNSLVAFRIPRFHQVTPVLVDKPRYSIFGWFLEPGIRYDLHTGQQQEVAAQAAQAAASSKAAEGPERNQQADPREPVQQAGQQRQPSKQQQAKQRRKRRKVARAKHEDSGS